MGHQQTSRVISKKKSLSKKTPVAVQEGHSERPLRELGREPNPSTALCQQSLWWGLHHSAPSPASLCSTLSFYGAGMGFQQGGMWDPCRKLSVCQHPPPPQKGSPRQLRDVPCPASPLPSRPTQSFLPPNTDSDRLSVAISMNRQQCIIVTLSVAKKKKKSQKTLCPAAVPRGSSEINPRMNFLRGSTYAFQKKKKKPSC